MAKKDLTGVFAPDAKLITEDGHSEYEADYLHYLGAKCLVEGALSLAEGNPSECLACMSIRGLLEAFLKSMETADDAFDEARLGHDLPVLTIDQLREMIGADGDAEVSAIKTANGCPDHRRYLVKAVPAAKKNGRKAA